MILNRGFTCNNCGVIEKATKKGQRMVCPVCIITVTPWERPLNERSGRCRTCAGGQFTNRIEKSDLIRTCKVCTEEYNIDKDKVIKKGVIKK